jgi:hypothetical protein
MEWYLRSHFSLQLILHHFYTVFGERLAEGSWTVGNPILGSAGACCQTHAMCISELHAALAAIELNAAESDGEEVEEGAHQFDWELD